MKMIMTDLEIMCDMLDPWRPCDVAVYINPLSHEPIQLN